MGTTPRLLMNELDEGGRQKEITINEALNTLDSVAYKHMGEFTVAGLPSAAANQGAFAIATNASGGRTIVASDGTNWKVIALESGTVS